MSTERSDMGGDVRVANRRLAASDNDALIAMAWVSAGAFGYTADLRIDRGSLSSAPAGFAAQQLHLLPQPGRAVADRRTRVRPGCVA
jgi:hypothetical protein